MKNHNMFKKEKGSHIDNGIKQWKNNWESQQTCALMQKDKDINLLLENR